MGTSPQLISNSFQSETAARTIGDLVSKVDKPTQSRLGKIVFPAPKMTMEFIVDPSESDALNCCPIGGKADMFHSITAESQLFDQRLQIVHGLVNRITTLVGKNRRVIHCLHSRGSY